MKQNTFITAHKQLHHNDIIWIQFLISSGISSWLLIDGGPFLCPLRWNKTVRLFWGWWCGGVGVPLGFGPSSMQQMGMAPTPPLPSLPLTLQAPDCQLYLRFVSAVIHHPSSGAHGRPGYAHANAKINLRPASRIINMHT